MPAYQPRAPLRPGEGREPLTGVLVDRRFAAAAAGRGVALAVATELTLERALVLADLESLDRANLFPGLLASAKHQRFVTPLPGPYRSYRASLLEAEPRALGEAELDEPVAVPLRLFPRVLALKYGEVLTEGALDEAIALELAALCTGRTMSEYALRFACLAHGP